MLHVYNWMPSDIAETESWLNNGIVYLTYTMAIFFGKCWCKVLSYTTCMLDCIRWCVLDNQVDMQSTLHNMA